MVSFLVLKSLNDLCSCEISDSSVDAFKDLICLFELYCVKPKFDNGVTVVGNLWDYYKKRWSVFHKTCSSVFVCAWQPSYFSLFWWPESKVDPG